MLSNNETKTIFLSQILLFPIPLVYMLKIRESFGIALHMRIQVECIICTEEKELC